MSSEPSLPNRRSLRLVHYDLSQSGAYFVTLCTQNRECLFGKVSDDRMHLNPFGHIVASEWLKTAELRPEVELDQWVVMPNHFHAIVVIASTIEATDDARGRSPRGSSNTPRGPKANSLSAIVAGFKSAVTRRINELRHTSARSVWQRNYYEHIIRNEESLTHIREYIANNPLQWALDRENPANLWTPPPARKPGMHAWEGV